MKNKITGWRNNKTKITRPEEAVKVSREFDRYIQILYQNYLRKMHMILSRSAKTVQVQMRNWYEIANADKDFIMTAYVVKDFFSSHAGSLRGTYSDALLAEVYSNAETYSLSHLAPVLSRILVLMIGGTKDYYAPPSLNCSPLLNSIQAIPGNRVLYQEFDTGHYGAECRGMISHMILRFLGVK